MNWWLNIHLHTKKIIYSSLVMLFTFHTANLQAVQIPLPRKEYCGNIEAIRKVIDTCDKNVIFVALLKKCYKRYQEEVKNSAKTLEKPGKGLETQQNEYFQIDNQLIEKTTDAIDSLQRRSLVAIEDINYFFVSTVQPDMLYEMPPSPQSSKIASKIPCFAEPRKYMEKYSIKFENAYISLSKARIFLEGANESNKTEILKLIGKNFAEIAENDSLTNQKQKSGFKSKKSGISENLRRKK